MVVCVVTVQMVGDRLFPGATTLGIEVVYFNHPVSVPPTGPEHSDASWSGQCSRWQVQYSQTGPTLRRHFSRAVAAPGTFVSVVAATSAWCRGTSQRNIASQMFPLLPTLRRRTSHAGEPSARSTPLTRRGSAARSTPLCGGFWYAFFPRVPDVRNRPSPLRGSRGDGNGGRFARSPCPFLTQYTRCCPFGPCSAAVHGAPSHNRWGVVETPLPVKTQGRTMNCLSTPATKYCCSVSSVVA